MKCIFCFEDIPDGSLFCPMCGRALPRIIKKTDEYAAMKGDDAPLPAEHASEERIPQGEERLAPPDVPCVEKQDVVFPGIEAPASYSLTAAKNASELPYGTPAAKARRKELNAYPVASLVIALVNSVCFLFLGIPFSAAGIIFALVGIKSERRGMAVASLILNAAAVIVGMILIVCFTVFAVKYSAELY